MATLNPDQLAENGGVIASGYERGFEGLRAQSKAGVPTLAVEACLGIGHA